MCQQTFDSNIHTKKRQREDLHKLCMSEQKWKKIAYMIKLLRSFHDETQRINKTRNATVNLVFFAYNNLFDYLKNQKIKCETIVIFWSDDLTRTLRKTSNKLSKYYAMIEKKRDTLYNIEILLDSTKKLVFYQISYFTNIFHEYFLTNIFHEHFSWTFFTNISYEHFSRTFLANISRQHFSRTFFANISREHFTFTFNFLILITLYKANVENSCIRHFIKINSCLIFNAITRNNRRSTLEKRMMWYKKKLY